MFVKKLFKKSVRNRKLAGLVNLADLFKKSGFRRLPNVREPIGQFPPLQRRTCILANPIYFSISFLFCGSVR